jgi:hypothetical protein
VDQGRCLERLPWLLLSEFLSRELAQFSIDQRQVLLGGMRVALRDGRQEASHIVHAVTE